MRRVVPPRAARSLREVSQQTQGAVASLPLRALRFALQHRLEGTLDA